MMKTKERKVYLVPQCQIAKMSEETSLMATSFPGQHKKANHGTGPASAKSAPAWQEDNEDTWNSPSWED